MTWIGRLFTGGGPKVVIRLAGNATFEAGTIAFTVTKAGFANNVTAAGQPV